MGDRYFRAQILNRIANDELTPAERTQFIKSSGPKIRKAIEVLSHRRQPVKQSDVNTAVGKIRRQGMLNVIE